MTADVRIFTVGPADGLIISILVLFLGMALTRRVKLLDDLYIPPAVTGGLICSAIVAIVHAAADVEIQFDMQLRDLLLLMFFSTIGLTARFRTLFTGGKALVALTAIAGVFLVVQDATGVALALLLDANPGYGLMAGSVSLAGGHGTAIAWGAEAEAAGLANAGAVGVVFATFGLIAGGLIGGPIARMLLVRNRLARSAGDADDGGEAEGVQTPAASLYDVLVAILLLAVCVEAGHLINRLLFEKGVLLPGFLTAMLVGIVAINLIDRLDLKVNEQAIGRMGEVSLNIFLAMSLMSMQLWLLAGAAVSVMIVLMVQVLVMTLFAMIIVFRLMGRDYDAVVITAGFAGLGLGATPVAIANMTSVTTRYGPSTKAFLIVPLVGAFFIDLMNAVTIKAFIGAIARWLS